MFRFEHTEYLWALLLIPLLIGLYGFRYFRRRSDLKKFGNPVIITSLMPDYSSFRRKVKTILLISVVALLVLAIAGPQFGSKLREVKREGIEIMVALDVSNSMLAEDIKPNRLERAKQELSRLMDKLENDRVGLIVFAGDAYTQIPITNDYLSAKMFLAGINTSMVSRQGTDIGSAIELATRSFSPKTAASKAIIIISDGENHEGNVKEACEKATKSGIRIYTIGMGLPQGVRIPLNENEYNRDFRRDNKGNFVVTRLNEQMLADIAASGDGKYYRANSPNIGLNDLLSHLDQLNKTEMKFRVYTEFEEQFPVLVWVAFGLLVFDFILIDRKNRWFRIRLFD